jgi:hypothetical protein
MTARLVCCHQDLNTTTKRLENSEYAMKAATGGGNTAIAVRGAKSAAFITQKKIQVWMITDIDRAAKSCLDFFCLLLFKTYCNLGHS